MYKKKKNKINIKKKIGNIFTSICLRSNGSIDLLQILIFCIYFFLGSKIVKLTKKRDVSNILPYNLTNIHWTPKGDRIKTKWGINLDPNNVWKEYPRPQLERKEWINLNGFWLYSITEIGMTKPKKADGNILIPFPIESSLSGVKKNFTQNQIIFKIKKLTMNPLPK